MLFDDIYVMIKLVSAEIIYHNCYK